MYMLRLAKWPAALGQATATWLRVMLRLTTTLNGPCCKIYIYMYIYKYITKGQPTYPNIWVNYNMSLI